MKSRYWIILGLALAFFILITVPIFLYYTPLGPPLELEGAPEVASAAVLPETGGQPAAQAEPITAPLKQEEPTVCGEEGRVNILYLGQNLPETPVRGADSVRLMFVNYDAPSVAILSMPPDLLVTNPNNPDIDPSTLTYTFWYGKQPPPQGEPAAARKATELVAQALLDTFQFETEKYMTMNQPVFAECVDDLGGVDVLVEWNAPNSFDPANPFVGGTTETMLGDRALDYIRIQAPSPDGPPEWARFQRQNAVVDGIYAALFETENLLNMPSVIGDFYSLLVTDLKPKELRSLYCMLDEENADYKYYEVEEGWITGYGPNGEMYADIGIVSGLIEQLAAGELP